MKGFSKTTRMDSCTTDAVSMHRWLRRSRYILHAIFLCTILAVGGEVLFSRSLLDARENISSYMLAKAGSIDPQAELTKLLQADKSLKPISKGLARALRFVASGPSLKKGERKRISGRTGAAIEIESIPSLQAYVIYLPEKTFFIGEGRHKKVTKAIFIKNGSAYVAAHCWGDPSTLQEAGVLKSMQGKNGIVPFLGAISRKGGRYYSIFLLYCNGGELRAFVHNPTVTLSFKERMIIARDAVQGLKSLHAKGFIHYDIHAGNVFLVKTEEGLRGVLGDFGHTFHIKKVGKRPGYVASRRVPPEALKIPITEIDRFKTDIHALGSVFYEIAWYDYHPWGGYLRRASSHLLPKKEKDRLYKQILRGYKASREKNVKSIILKRSLGAQLSPEEKFKLLVYRVMHYLPEKRPTLDQIEAELTSILAQIDS